jgi:hypothetical protein
LFTLLSGLEQDVFYAIDTSTHHRDGGPSLVIAIKQKFPDVDASSFLAAFKRCTSARKFAGHEHFFITPDQIRLTKWFMNRSIPNLEPAKNPDDQMMAFQCGEPLFWPYENTQPAGSTPYRFGRDSEDTVSSMLHSLKVSPSDGSPPTAEEIGYYVGVSRSRSRRCAHVSKTLTLYSRYGAIVHGNCAIGSHLIIPLVDLSSSQR